MFFIDKKGIPQERFKDITYGDIVCDYQEGKDEPNRTRLTVGGDRINYPGDCATPTADLLTVKLLINSTLSTLGTKFFTVDIKNFYLNTLSQYPLKRYAYVRLKLADIPDNVIEEYQLANKATKDGFVFVEIRKGMYVLPQAGLLAQ